MCEHTAITLKPRTSQSPLTRPPVQSRSQKTEQVSNRQQHSRYNAVDVTLEDAVKPMEVDRLDDVIPEERGKSELAKLFGEFELKAPEKDRASDQSQTDKLYSSSQPGTIHPSLLPVGRHESFPRASDSMDDGLHAVMPSGHITDLLDLLDDPLLFSTASSSGCDGLDYGMSSVSPAWTLRKFKPLALNADSPSPVKLYPRRLY